MLREFTDRQGVQWKVWEVFPTLPLSSGLTDGWLCFDRNGERRRFIGVPPGWELWDVDALTELCARAVPNGKGTGG